MMSIYISHMYCFQCAKYTEVDFKIIRSQKMDLKRDRLKILRYSFKCTLKGEKIMFFRISTFLKPIMMTSILVLSHNFYDILIKICIARTLYLKNQNFQRHAVYSASKISCHVLGLVFKKTTKIPLPKNGNEPANCEMCISLSKFKVLYTMMKIF